MKKKRDTFFVGWSPDIPNADRRFVLGAGALLLAGAAGLGASLGPLQNTPGNGSWDQGDIRHWTGLLHGSPYPLLRTLDLGEGLRTAFLATSGKTAVEPPSALIGTTVTVKASLIARGDHAMLAVDERSDDWIVPAPQADGGAFAVGAEQDLGAQALVGEILDAKCWFGAMRPGFGSTHKACASLCARGGLPLAFCTDGCAGSEAPLFLDERGRPHGRAIIEFVADPIFVIGRRVQVGDVTQFRAPIRSIRRL